MGQLSHIAIIMDGNGRWAQSRTRPRVWGHVRGSHVVSKIIRAADGFGAEALTLYAFSTENWNRPRHEVTLLFRLLYKFLLRERQNILDNRIRFKVIGHLHGLPDQTVQLIRDIEFETRNNRGLKLSFAFNYGSRLELVQAVNSFIEENPGRPVVAQDIEERLMTSESGPVDLLIRTGGECRLSNFLLWQLCYAELYFTPTLWPDFSVEEFEEILIQVQSRERRMGGVQASGTGIFGAFQMASERRKEFSEGAE